MFKSFATVGLLAAFAEALDLAASNKATEDIDADNVIDIVDLVVTGGDNIGTQDHDPASCFVETQYRGLPSQPTCPSGYDMFGVACLKHCRSGYDTYGIMCESQCPSGFRDDGAFCAKTKTRWSGPWYRRSLSFYQDCPSGMSDWGATCKKNEYHRETTAEDCLDKDQELGLCYNKCNDGFSGIGGACYGDCPAGTENCGGVFCLGPTEGCTERLISLTAGIMRMVALSASSPSGIGAVLAVKEIYDFAQDVNYPICNA